MTGSIQPTPTPDTITTVLGRFDADALFAFSPKTFDARGHKMAYLDEGEGAHTVVMVHGNPTWSFYYRNLVNALSGTYRCIVPDHVGCGMSARPGLDGYAFSLDDRITDLELLLAHANVSDKVTLVAHDWGGMIAMAWARRHPERVARIVLMNTGAFPLPTGERLPLRIKLGRESTMGAGMIRQFGAFSRSAVRMCMTRTRMGEDVRRGFLAPYQTPHEREAVAKFVQTIPMAPADEGWDEIKAVEASLDQFKGIPRLLVWGHKDFVFDKAFFDTFVGHWPDAETMYLDDAGHYVLEDAKEDVIPRIEAFLAAHPVTMR